MTAELYLAYVLACVVIAIIPGPRDCPYLLSVGRFFSSGRIARS